MSALPAPRSDSAATFDPVADVWDLHFRDPVTALARAKALLDDRFADARTLAWAELTHAFHDLFLSPKPDSARAWLDRAEPRFGALDERRGVLLARTARARLMLIAQAPLPARDALLEIRAEAMECLPPHDRFWVINALGATYYYTDEIDEAIRHLYEALETLRLVDLSPQLPTVMSNLAAALVTVGDYAPARELAQEAVEMLGRYSNAQALLYARSNLAEALLGVGDLAGALAAVEAMDDGGAARHSPQNHYCAVAAEIYAKHGRLDDAMRCIGAARSIARDFPGGFNPVYLRWAEAAVAAARDAGEGALPALLDAVAAASKHRHIPTLCKAHALLAERYAGLGSYEHAYRHLRSLFEANDARLSSRASVKYYLLKVEHELTHARAERDRALRQRHETDALNRQLEQLNAELSRKVEEIEQLQARLAAEAVRDPLTRLFNRRHIDAVMPGLLGAAARRDAPLALVLLDLDYFKRVNDRHGHLAGDKVLRKIGELLATALRPSDVVCRYGGEEFCIVLPDTDVAGACTAMRLLAERLKVLEVPWASETLTAFTFSAGLAVYPEHGTTFDALVSAADRTLYVAKTAGRAQILVANEGS